MNKLDFYVGGTTMRCHDAAIILEGDDPLATMIESAIGAISTDVEITCGGITMHLAAWQDPDQWSEDWEAKGINPDDVSGLVAAAVRSG